VSIASGIWLEVDSSSQSRSIRLPPRTKRTGLKKFFRRGVAHNHFSRVARLVADIGREILRPGRRAKVEIKRVELRAHKLIQHASGENAALPTALTDQCELTRAKRF
jgi:hypothetical protein